MISLGTTFVGSTDYNVASVWLVVVVVVVAWRSPALSSFAVRTFVGMFMLIRSLILDIISLIEPLPNKSFARWPFSLFPSGLNKNAVSLKLHVH